MPRRAGDSRAVVRRSKGFGQLAATFLTFGFGGGAGFSVVSAESSTPSLTAAAIPTGALQSRQRRGERVTALGHSGSDPWPAVDEQRERRWRPLLQRETAVGPMLGATGCCGIFRSVRASTVTSTRRRSAGGAGPAWSAAATRAGGRPTFATCLAPRTDHTALRSGANSSRSATARASGTCSADVVPPPGVDRARSCAAPKCVAGRGTGADRWGISRSLFARTRLPRLPSHARSRRARPDCPRALAMFPRREAIRMSGCEQPLGLG
jgi:hypothetical protein